MNTRDRGIELKAGGVGGGLKRMSMLVGIAFVVTLAVVIGKEMSTDAMAVVIGIICGVAASIPTSILLLVVLTRRDQAKDEESIRRSKQNNPPVVVIQGGTPQGLPQGSQAGYWASPAPGPAITRQFHVVGDDDLLLDA